MAAKRSRVYAPPRRRSAPAPRRAKKPAPRRQYVKLRSRQREEFSRRLGTVLKRGLIVFAMVIVGALFAWHSQDWIQRQLNRHTPVLDLKAPEGLTGLPVFSALPKRRWLLWIPGVPLVAEHRLQKKFPAVWHAQIDGHFFENRIGIHLQPRVPLVQCHGSFMDAEGVLFSLDQAPEATLPQLILAHAQPPAHIGAWLLALSHIPWLWSDVAELKENSQGAWTVRLQSGPVLLWGFSDDNATLKAEALQKTIVRAAADHGGFVRADLRFFREGRIIVGVRRPPHA